MRNPRVWCTLAAVLCLAAGTTSYGRGLGTGVVVDLPRNVTVNERTLAAGEYEIQKVSTVNPVFRFFSKDQLKFETFALSINAESNDVVETPKIVMEKVGPEYYLTEIWLGGSSSGYEFPLPDRAKSLKRELQQTVPAEKTQGEPLTSKSDNSTDSTGVAAKNNPTNPPRSETTPGNDVGPTAGNRSDVAQEPLEAADTSIEEQQPDQAPQIAQNVPARQDSAPPAQQPASPATAQPASAEPQSAGTLPATASDWMISMLVGLSLLTLAALLYRG